MRRAFVQLLLAAAVAACGGGGGGVDVSAPVPAPGAAPVSGPAPAPGPTGSATGQDWVTHQGNAAHTGYVDDTLEPSAFAKLWEWQRPFDDGSIVAINNVVTGHGKVYVTNDVYFGDGVVRAFDEATGTEAWRASLGTLPAMGPAALDGDALFVPTTGHEDTFLWAFDANSGALLRKSAFETQWSNAFPPTIHDGLAYVGAGYYGGMLYGFSTRTGELAWSYEARGAWDTFTPAVDDRFVFHHNGSALHVYDKAANAASVIEDPFGGDSDSSYHGAPMIGGRGNVVAFARGSFSGRALSSAEQYEQRVLSSFAIASRRHEWATPYAYLTAPAVANGVIYAARNSPMSFDAIDEITGRVLWSWTPPSENGDASFHRNTVVTRNLAFVSTDKAIYAVDLATRQAVWRHPEPGVIAISAQRRLLLNVGATVSTGKLVAFKLR